MRESLTNRSYNKKVAIIGMGYVGSGIAYSLMIKDIAREIVFIDIKEQTVNAEMLDIRHGIPGMGSAKIICGDYKDIKDCDLIIITAGRNRNPDENRLDLAGDNVKTANDIAENIKKYYQQGVVLVVSNPVDITTYYVAKNLNLPKGRVFGTGCILDSSRLTNVIADYVNLDTEFISATIIGEHGGSQIPLWSNIKVAQIPIKKFCELTNIKFDETIKSDMAKKVLDMGTEIIKGKGKTYYGISTCVCHIADAILNKRAITASVSTLLDGEYGLSDLSLSLPSIIDQNGVKFILPVEISDFEYKQLQSSANIIKQTIKTIAEKQLTNTLKV
jgi:L-lactate dehydrogenase